MHEPYLLPDGQRSLFGEMVAPTTAGDSGVMLYQVTACDGLAIDAGAPAPVADNWVQCDRCGQWRRVTQDVVDSLEDDSNWFCEDNPDQLHNSCTVPQEMTNAEIDRGRQLETLECERLRRKRRPAVWQLIRCVQLVLVCRWSDCNRWMLSPADSPRFGQQHPLFISCGAVAMQLRIVSLWC
jgi:hypothetical protein